MWLRSLPNYAALTESNIVHNIAFHANPEEPLPNQRQGTVLALVSRCIMETMEDFLLQRVRHYELEDLLVCVGIFPRPAQHDMSLPQCFSNLITLCDSTALSHLVALLCLRTKYMALLIVLSASC